MNDAIESSGDVVQPGDDDLRGSVRPADELPERRPSRRRVDVDGVDESLRPLVDDAVSLVAEWLGVGRDQVVPEAATSVTWSDASCGCPEAGRAYAQVPVDGVYVRLSAGGREFHVHGGGRRDLFLCDG